MKIALHAPKICQIDNDTFLSKIQNHTSEKTGKKILLLYGKIKVGVVDFTKARGLVKFQSPWALRALGL